MQYAFFDIYGRRRRRLEVLANTVKRLIYYLLVVTHRKTNMDVVTRMEEGSQVSPSQQSINYATSSSDENKSNPNKKYVGPKANLELGSFDKADKMTIQGMEMKTNWIIEKIVDAAKWATVFTLAEFNSPCPSNSQILGFRLCPLTQNLIDWF